MYNIEALLTPEGMLSLFTLTVMEIVLGIDNIVFLTIVSGRLPKRQQPKARQIGLILALIPRIILLMFISWIISLDKPLISLGILSTNEDDLSGKEIILLLGGLFLLYSSTSEIHHKLEGEEHARNEKPEHAKALSFGGALVSIMLLNVVFSFDSVLTAIGLSKNIFIMIIAVVLSGIVMILFAGIVGDFVNKHPTVKMLALSFLLMIGFLLVAEAFEIEVPKGYVYFSMGFSLFVEILNLRMMKKTSIAKIDKYIEKAPPIEDKEEQEKEKIEENN